MSPFDGSTVGNYLCTVSHASCMDNGEAVQSTTDGDRRKTRTTQGQLVEGEEQPEQKSVYVVASRKEDSPHPFVEAVYDNEKAAKAHHSELGENAFQHGVVAWEMHERTLLSEYNDE